MKAREAFGKVREQVRKSIVGQEHVIDRLLIGLLANGNILLEGLPGLGKTRSVRSLAASLTAELSRIQFTPDLLPSDITGTEVYLGEEAKERFVFQEGPLFSNLVLADEINRAPAKVQAALLEAMEERQVTVAGKTHSLPEVFMVLATQNPIEQEGTYPLPEAQLDRFLMHVKVEYPSVEDEVKILRLVRGEEQKEKADIEPVSQDMVLSARKEVSALESSQAIDDYIVALVSATRNPNKFGEKLGRWIEVGSSPRGTLALDRCARAHAWMNDREMVTPDDVRAVVQDCLRHRIILSYEASADGLSTDDAIQELVKSVAVA